MKKISEIIKDLQNSRKNPVLILNLETINRMDLIKVQYKLHGKSFKNLDVILHTPGGDIDAAFLFSKLLMKATEELNIIVPWYSKSAGTLMCLSADELIMTNLSELGPLDTQIQEDQNGDTEYISALNGFKALEQVQKHTIETLDIAVKLIYSRSSMKISESVHLANEFAGHTSGTLYSQLNPKKIGEYARALEIGDRYGMMILTRYKKWTNERAKTLIKKLVYDYPSHSFVIDYEELSSLGFNAVNASDELYPYLMELRTNFIAKPGSIIELFEPDDVKDDDNIKKIKAEAKPKTQAKAIKSKGK